MKTLSVVAVLLLTGCVSILDPRSFVRRHAGAEAKKIVRHEAGVIVMTGLKQIVKEQSEIATGIGVLLGGGLLLKGKKWLPKK